MPVSSLTPLSLTASVNLSRLREAFRDLENNYDFFVDDNYLNREANMNSYVFEEDFECSYFENYDVLKLGDFHIFSEI